MLQKIAIFFFFREEMEDVVGSVFDLMGRTSDPILEEEVINSRVDYIFEVKFHSSNIQVLQVEIVLNVLAFTSNKMEILWTTKILFKSKCIKVVQSTMMAFVKRALYISITTLLLQKVFPHLATVNLSFDGSKWNLYRVSAQVSNWF